MILRFEIWWSKLIYAVIPWLWSQIFDDPVFMIWQKSWSQSLGSWITVIPWLWSIEFNDPLNFRFLAMGLKLWYYSYQTPPPWDFQTLLKQGGVYSDVNFRIPDCPVKCCDSNFFGVYSGKSALIYGERGGVYTVVSPKPQIWGLNRGGCLISIIRCIVKKYTYAYKYIWRQ